MSYGDCQLPEFFDEKLPVARKDHKCCECGKPIPRGMKYWSCTGKWDGDVKTYKQHIECRDACYTFQEYGEECIGFGTLYEHVHPTWDDHKAWWKETDGDGPWKRERSEGEVEMRKYLAAGLRASRLNTQDQIRSYNARHVNRC